MVKDLNINFEIRVHSIDLYDMILKICGNYKVSIHACYLGDSIMIEYSIEIFKIFKRAIFYLIRRSQLTLKLNMRKIEIF